MAQRYYGPRRVQARLELAALQAREGTSLLAGIWPLLAQWPFLSVMYLLFRSAQVGGGPNELLTHRLLAAPLGAHWLSGAAAPGSLRLITTALPYLTVAFAAFLPLAAGLYLVTTVAWTTAERWLYAHRTATRPTPAPGGDSQAARRTRTKARASGMPHYGTLYR